MNFLMIGLVVMHDVGQRTRVQLKKMLHLHGFYFACSDST
jgi:hypothetical protein